MSLNKAFTLIEVIFVIIILGILSVVAIPKFIGVSEEAHMSNCKSAIGTMNRTVGLNFWSKSLTDGKDGNVSEYVTEEGLSKNLPDYNATYCGAIIGLTPGAAAAGDGEYGSPQLVHEGNMTDSPHWIWVKK